MHALRLIVAVDDVVFHTGQCAQFVARDLPLIEQLPELDSDVSVILCLIGHDAFIVAHLHTPYSRLVYQRNYLFIFTILKVALISGKSTGGVSMDETLMTYLRNIISLEQAVYVETSG